MVPTDLTWRFANPNDTPALRRIHEELFPIQYDDFFYDSLCHEGHYTFLGTHDPEVCAVFAARIERHYKLLGCFLKSSKKSAYLMTFGVSKPYRNRGIGKYLFQESVTLLKKKEKIEYIDLHVLVSNTPALKFYEKLGFIVKEKKNNYYYFDNKYQHAFLMRLKLSSSEKELKLLNSGDNSNVVTYFLFFMVIVLIVAVVVLFSFGYKK